MKSHSILILVGLSLVSAGCPRRNSAKDAAAPIRTYAVIPKQLDNPVFDLTREGALAAAKKQGRITINWKAPASHDAAAQAKIVEEMVNAKVSGIAISCSNAAVLKPAIDRAEDAGIPVVCFDSDSPDSKRLSFIGIDDRAAGRKLGEFLKAALPEGGDVAVLTGAMGADNLDNRVEGFKEAIENSNLKLISVYPCDDDVAKSMAIVRDYTRSHPNVKGWCFVGGWPLFTAPPGPFEGTKPGDLKVVAFDTVKPELEYIRTGYVTALVGQKYYEWGRISVDLLHKAADGDEIPTSVDCGIEVVTKDNLDAFERKQQRP